MNVRTIGSVPYIVIAFPSSHKKWLPKSITILQLIIIMLAILRVRHASCDN